MNKATAKLLSKDNRSLVRATEPARLQKLDEEELLALHKRVRRARNKYSKNYRRQGAAAVKADRSRGLASKKNQRSATKAAVFETALGRVSTALAKESHRNARAIKKERIAAANKAKRSAARTPASKEAAVAKKRKREAAATAARTTRGGGKKNLKTPISKKDRATARASGKRSQARRDKH